MTLNHLTRIVALIDRSGSMKNIHADMIGGFNEFLTKLKSQPGEASLSVFQFDDQYEKVYDSPLYKARDLTIDDCSPRGRTNLYEALGQTIDALGLEMTGIQESERPGKVICLVITDGQNNVRGNYTQAQVANMIRHQQGKYGWEFVLLGANMDALTVAHDLNIPKGSSITWAANSYGVQNAMHAATNYVNASRSVRGSSFGSYEFTTADRLAALVDVDASFGQSSQIPVPGKPATQTQDATTQQAGQHSHEKQTA